MCLTFNSKKFRPKRRIKYGYKRVFPRWGGGGFHSEFEYATYKLGRKVISDRRSRKVTKFEKRCEGICRGLHFYVHEYNVKEYWCRAGVLIKCAIKQKDIVAVGKFNGCDSFVAMEAMPVAYRKFASGAKWRKS
jgi:hypothetical protein